MREKIEEPRHKAREKDERYETRCKRDMMAREENRLDEKEEKERIVTISLFLGYRLKSG